MGSDYLHRNPLLNMFRGGFLLLEAALNLVLARIVRRSDFVSYRGKDPTGRMCAVKEVNRFCVKKCSAFMTLRQKVPEPFVRALLFW